MRYLFKWLDQQTTTTAHPQWAMGTHRSAPCLHLDGLVTHLDTLIFFEFPLLKIIKNGSPVFFVLPEVRLSGTRKEISGKGMNKSKFDL